MNESVKLNGKLSPSIQDNEIKSIKEKRNQFTKRERPERRQQHKPPEIVERLARRDNLQVPAIIAVSSTSNERCQEIFNSVTLELDFGIRIAHVRLRITILKLSTSTRIWTQYVCS